MLMRKVILSCLSVILGTMAYSQTRLDSLLLRNRSCRGYDKSYVVSLEELESIISVNTCVACGGNIQNLRFRPVVKGPEAEAVLGNVKMGAYLRELNLPLPGTEPEAFIVVCSKIKENATVDINLGISLQSMLLKAVDMGLSGLIIRSFNAGEISERLSLPFAPIAVVAIGKSAEHIELVPVKEGDDLKYYRDSTTHYVPKIIAGDLIIR